jgi:hypothetical protein
MSRRLQEFLLVVAVGIGVVYGLTLLAEVPIFGGIISVLADLLMAIIAIVILGGLVEGAITNRREKR